MESIPEGIAANFATVCRVPTDLEPVESDARISTIFDEVRVAFNIEDFSTKHQPDGFLRVH